MSDDSGALDAEGTYRASSDDIRRQLPRRVKEGFTYTLDLGVYEASEPDVKGIEEPRPNTMGEPPATVQVKVYNPDDKKGVLWGIPTDGEYWDHSCHDLSAGTLDSDLTPRMQDWLDDLLTNHLTDVVEYAEVQA